MDVLSVSDCLQFQSDHDQSRLPAGQRICRPPGRHLGPRRHQNPTRGSRYSLCRQVSTFSLDVCFSSDSSSVRLNGFAFFIFYFFIVSGLMRSDWVLHWSLIRPHCDAVEHRDGKVPPQISGPSRIRYLEIFRVFMCSSLSNVDFF